VLGCALATLVFLEARAAASYQLAPAAGQPNAAATSTVVTLTWMLAPALFIIVWLTRPRIKTEIADWR
jgi:hypothetical protein